jgi:hypothetical protein
MRALSSTNVHFCWAGAAVLVMALGCGGSTDSPSTTGATGGTGGSGTSGGSGGSGGSTGGSGGSTGGTGGSGGASGGLPDGGDVICGSTICPPTPIGMTSIPACCTMQNTCGISLGQACFDPSIFDAGPPPPEAGTGVPDPNCISVTVFGNTLGGCCMTDNTCGFVSQFGGCVSLETLRTFMIPGLPDGGPMSCVYPPP